MRHQIARKTLKNVAIVCLSFLFGAQYAAAGPITTAYGENQASFVATASHGVIAANGSHSFADFAITDFWRVVVEITEVDGRGLVADTISGYVSARHLVRVPGHDIAEIQPNTDGLFVSFFSGIGAFTPGLHVINLGDVEPHPTIDGHTDTLKIILTFGVSADKKNFDSYALNATGTHCEGTTSAVCPLPADVTGSLQPIPEPGSYAMLLAGLGLLGFAVRRRKQQVA